MLIIFLKSSWPKSSVSIQYVLCMRADILCRSKGVQSQWRVPVCIVPGGTLRVINKKADRNVACMGDMIDTYKILVDISVRNDVYGRIILIWIVKK
jgi:hypothetical protein